MNTDIENLFKDKVLGHPAGLFVLFFTEMWETFFPFMECVYY
jgi:POT family proton-dependent oligopeptide transporter